DCDISQHYASPPGAHSASDTRLVSVVVDAVLWMVSSNRGMEWCLSVSSYVSEKFAVGAFVAFSASNWNSSTRLRIHNAFEPASALFILHIIRPRIAPCQTGLIFFTLVTVR